MTSAFKNVNFILIIEITNKLAKIIKNTYKHWIKISLDDISNTCNNICEVKWMGHHDHALTLNHIVWQKSFDITFIYLMERNI